MSSWDRRLVLSAVRELNRFSVKSIFIREDLSPDERKKRREKHLKKYDAGQASPTKKQSASAVTSPVRSMQDSDSEQ